MSIPLLCNHCGRHFISRAISIEGSASVSIGTIVESCPHCRRTATSRGGSYEFVKGAITSVRDYDPIALGRLKSVLEDTQAGRANPDALVAEAEAISPQFGRLVAILQAAGGLTLLLTMIGLWLQYSAFRSDQEDQDAMMSELRTSNAHQEQLIEGMRELIEAQNERGPPSDSSLRPRTSHTPPSTTSPEVGRASKRRAWKEAKKASKDRSIKFKP